MRHKQIFLFLLFACNCISCNDQPTCIPEQTDLMKMVFVDESGKAKNIEYIELKVKGSNVDFPIPQDTTLSSLVIPLNPNDSIVNLTFYQPEDTNKLVISYIAKPAVLHPDCVLETNFDFLKIDSTSFIEAIIVDPLLSLETPNNVKIIH